MSDVLFKKPDGTFVTVDSSEAAQAQQLGYEPSTPEQAAAAEQPVRAGLEGAARGASFGLSDLALQAYGVSKRPEMQARKEENPLAAGLGEVAGAVGTSVVTGGGAAAALGGGVRGIALESGLMGIGSMVSESALENKELTSEHLAAGFLGGAGVGAGAAAGFGLLGKAGSAALSKFGGGSLRGALHEAAYTMEERQLAQGNKALLKKLEKSGGSLRDVVKYAREEGVPVEFTETAKEAATAALEKTGGQTAELMRKLDYARPLKDEAARKALVDRVKSTLQESFKGNIAAEETVAEFAAKNLDPLVSREGLTYPELYKLQSEIRKKVGVVDETLKKEVWNAGRKALRNTIFTEAESLGAETTGKLHGLQAQYAKGAVLQDAITSGLQGMQSTGGVPGTGLMDIVRGGGIGGSIGASILGPVGAPLGAIAGAYVNRAVREKGGSMAANALRSIADSQVTKGVSKALETHLKGVLSAAPALLGAYRYPLAEAAAKGADALLQEHIRLASGATGQDYLARTGLATETPEEVDAAGQRLAVLDSAKQAQLAHDMEMSKAIDGLFGSAKGRKGAVGSSMGLKEFTAKSDAIKAVMQRPDSVFEQLPPNLMSAAPTTASMTAAKLVQANQFLHDKMPKNPYAAVPESVRPEWQPSAAEIERFNRYREAVESPAKALKNMAQGYLSAEQVEALKAVYPAIYSDLQQKLSERIAESKKPLSYQQKMAVSQILGPTAIGMSSQQAQVLQQMHAQGAGKPEQGSAKKDGRQEVDAAKNQSTQAQRLESR